MNYIPVSARSAWQRGQIDVTDGTLSAVLIADTYTFSTGHDFLADVPSGARAATAVVAAPSETDGEVFGLVIFIGVPAGPTCTQLWFYMGTGSDATSRLVAYVDQYADRRPIASDPIIPNGTTIGLAWPDNRLFAIGSPV